MAVLEPGPAPEKGEDALLARSWFFQVRTRGCPRGGVEVSRRRS
jgi:hypothetical protein